MDLRLCGHEAIKCCYGLLSVQVVGMRGIAGSTVLYRVCKLMTVIRPIETHQSAWWYHLACRFAALQECTLAHFLSCSNVDSLPWLS